MVPYADGPDPAYGLLETIRQYAEQRMDPDDIAEEHEIATPAYFSVFLERAERRRFPSPEMLETIRRVEHETENVARRLRLGARA